MKKLESMDLYEGINGIEPELIEEAGNYQKKDSAHLRSRKGSTVKKIVAAGLVAAAAAALVSGAGELKRIKVGSDNQIVTEQQPEIKMAHVMNVYAAGLDDVSECIFSGSEKNADVSGVVAGISSQVGDSSVMGMIMAGINVTGDNILNIKYSVMGEDSDVTCKLAIMREVDKESPEYQASAYKFRKQTDAGYAYYIIEDIGEEYEESDSSQNEGIQIVKFSKELEAGNLYQNRQVYNDMVKSMYEGLNISITVTYGDETAEVVNIGFKAVDDSDLSENVSDKVAVYVK